MSRFVTICLVILSLTLSSLLFAQRPPAQGQPDIVQQIGPILKQMQQPLTQQQVQQLRSLKAGPQMQQQIFNVLTQQQLTALQQAAQMQQQQGGQQQQGPGMAEILSQSGQPLSKEQSTSLEKLEPGPEARKEMMGILTDKQVAALLGYMENGPGNNIAKVLDQGGEGLTINQLRELYSVQPGPDSKAQMDDILTDDQRDILEPEQEGNSE